VIGRLGGDLSALEAHISYRYTRGKTEGICLSLNDPYDGYRVRLAGKLRELMHGTANPAPIGALGRHYHLDFSKLETSKHAVWSLARQT
jgi:hypothetical protein